MLINTLGVAVPTSHHWPVGDEGKQSPLTTYIVQIEITSPLRVFSARFRGRWVSRCIRHATAKFGSLVHRFGMISVGLHARDFFLSKLDPQNRGYFEGGAGTFFYKSEATVIENTPIFPRTERVLAESPATLRESCSPEKKPLWPFCPRPTLDVCALALDALSLYGQKAVR